MMLSSPCPQHSWSSCCPSTLWKASLSLQTKALSYSEETWWRAGRFPQPSLLGPLLLNALGGLIISWETNAYVFLQKSEGPQATSCRNPKVLHQTMLKKHCISSEKKLIFFSRNRGASWWQPSAINLWIITPAEANPRVITSAKK